MRIDCHNHLSFSEGKDILAPLRKFGIDRTLCSRPLSVGRDDHEAVRKANDDVLLGMKRYPGVVLGYCFLNPGYPREAQQEITRCVVEGGMIGVKLLVQYRMDEPVQYPVIERCIELGVPILMHAGHLTDADDQGRQPRISGGEHFIAPAKRYPEALLICGHIGGGGDWEWQLKALRDAPGVFLDTSGSVIDRGMIEQCVGELGAERLLFGTDAQYARGVGKILDARISDRQREMIFSGNMERILARRRAPPRLAERKQQ